MESSQNKDDMYKKSPKQLPDFILFLGLVTFFALIFALWIFPDLDFGLIMALGLFDIIGSIAFAFIVAKRKKIDWDPDLSQVHW